MSIASGSSVQPGDTARKWIDLQKWLQRVLRWWLLSALALTPFAASAGCYIDGFETICAAPNISIRTPSNGQSIVTGTPVNVIVDAYDYVPDESTHTSLIYEIRLYVNGTYTQVQRYSPNAVQATADFALGALAAGTYALKATVMDQQGRERSAQVQITVAGPTLTSTQTTLLATPNPVEAGRPTTLSATVNGNGPTGTVTFRRDGQVGTAVGMSGGQASFQMTFPDVGSIYVGATYSGDSKNQGSATPLLLVVVQKRQTSVRLVSNVPSVPLNGPVTLSASVDGTSPTGTVTFMVGGTALQTVSLSNGEASLTTTFPSAGSRSITAVYNGDSNNAAATSSVVNVGVQMLAGVALAASSTSIVVSQPITYTATVSGASPTGAVQFYESGNPQGVPVTISGGKASLISAYETAGTRSMSAIYLGDSNNLGNSSGALEISVGRRTTGLGLTSSATESALGNSLTLIAAVDGTKPTGSVQFSANGATLGGPVSVVGNSATLSTSFSTARTHAISAAYSGDANNAPSTSNTVSLTVPRQASATSLSSTVSSSTSVGQAVTFTANINGYNPTGTVTFTKSGVAIAAAVPVTSGQAALNYSFPASGVATLAAVYSGDTNNTGSTSSSINIPVDKRNSSISLSTSSPTVQPGKPFVLTALIDGTSPTGTLTFFDGDQAIGTSSLTGETATKSVTLNTLGQHKLLVRYDGDGNHVAAQSQPVTVTVTISAVDITVPHVGNPRAGSLPGSVEVSGGKAVYSIPIALPPGVAGMVPTVSLDYNGSTANGIAGVGWAISGRSTISRCSPTLAQDGRTDTVLLRSEDRLCLDGRRLVLVTPADAGADGTAAYNDAYWSTTATYRTESDIFSLVKREGDSFVVYSKDGRIHTYGDTDDARQGTHLSYIPGPNETIHTWWLRQSKDRSGNSIGYQYTKNSETGEHLLTSINWGANVSAQQSAFAKVEFEYEARPDIEVRHVAGGRSDVRQRLKTVTTWTDLASNGSGTQALAYQLVYGVSPSSNRSMLSSIQACSPVDGCLPATNFLWGEPDPSAVRAYVSKGVWTGPTLEDRFEVGVGTAGHSQDELFVAGDFDGDGRADIITRFGGPNIKLYRSTGSGFAVSQPFSGVDELMAIVDVGDFDGDGQKDLLVAKANRDMYGVPQVVNEILSNWQICYSRVRQTGGFQCVDWNVDSLNAIQRVVYDFNADGRDDLYFSGGSPGLGNIGTQRSCISTGLGFTCTVVPVEQGMDLSSDGAHVSFTQFSPLAAADLDGDGRLDFITAGQAVYNAEGDFFTFTEPYIIGKGYSSEVGQPVNGRQVLLHDYGIPPEYRVNTPASYRASAAGTAGDLNGDGYSDFVFRYGPTPSAAQTTQLCLNTGIMSSPLCEERTDFTMSPNWYIGNIEGDGVARLLTGRPAALLTKSPEACLLRFGSPAICKTWTVPAQPPNVSPNPGVTWQKSRIFFLDFTGDGHAEIIYYQAGGKWEVLEHARLAKSGEALDRLIQVTNGAGLPTRVEYSTPGDTSVYNPDAKGPGGESINFTYPQQRVPQLDHLVSGLKVGNGQGGWLEVRYSYAGSANDTRGRGYLGFARVDSNDIASGITTSVWYAQSWPYVGQVLATRQVSAAGVVLSKGTTELGVDIITHTSGRSTVFPHNKVETVQKTDLNGDAMGTVSVETTYEPGWGNPTRAAETTSGNGKTFTSTTVKTYENRVSDWLIGLERRIEATKTRDGLSTTRTITKDFDANGLQYQQTIEPDAPEYRVATSLSRSGNSLGLVSKEVQRWMDPQTHTDILRTSVEVLEFDGKGRFPIKSTNAAGHLETKTFDNRSGGVTLATSPNGVTTRWSVDAFGLVTNEQRPDGTETRTLVVQCDADCPPYATQVKIVDNFASGQRFGSPTLTYTDSAGHVLRNRTNGFYGQAVVADQRFDSRGRLFEKDRPRFLDEAAYLESRHVYDDLNREISITFLGDDGIAQTATTTYKGFEIVATNAKRFTTSTFRDVAGLVERVVDAQGSETNFTREPFGLLKVTRDPNGNEVTVTVDRLGRRISLKDPDLGLHTYEFDPVGREWRHTSPKNQITTSQFDVLDRITAKHEIDLDSYWIFDTADHGIGQLAETYTFAGGQKDYQRTQSFDALGRQSGTTITLNGSAVQQRTQTTYDSLGRIDTVTYQRNSDPLKSFTQHYNAAGYVSGVSRGAAALWTVLFQDASSRVTQTSLGNGVSRTASFNPNTGRLVSAALRTPDGNVAMLEGYEYDVLSNVKQRTQIWDGAGFVEGFDYDGLQRLTSAQVVGQPQQIFAYDNIGNITSKTGMGTYAYPAAGQARPHAVQSVSSLVGNYVYDLSGNLLSGPKGELITWTSFDMPNRIERAGAWSQFAYGTDHQRARQTRSNGTTVLYLGPMEQETDTAGATTLRTYWPMGLGFEVERADGTTDLTWTHTDRIGSVIALTQSDGQFKEKYAYDAWGKRRTLDGAATPDQLDGLAYNRGFTGHEMLDNVDMVHMNGRIYDPALARFLSGDPLIQEPEHSQSYNRYTYVWNNPTNLTDPTGFRVNLTYDVSKEAKKACAGSADPSECQKDMVAKLLMRELAKLFGGKIVLVTNGASNPSDGENSGSGNSREKTLLQSAQEKISSTVSAARDSASKELHSAASDFNSAADYLMPSDELAILFFPSIAPSMLARDISGTAEFAARVLDGEATNGEYAVAGLGLLLKFPGKSGIKGGTYVLRNSEEKVMRSGRSKDLARRKAEHARDEQLADLRFEIVHETDIRPQQRGLEQMLHDEHNPPLNAIRPISPRNPRLNEYMEAARRFLGIN